MKHLISIGLVAGAMSMFCEMTSSNDDGPYGYVFDSAGNVVRSASGECVQALYTKQNVAPECTASTLPIAVYTAEPPPPAPAPEPAATMPDDAPVAAATPEPVPVEQTSETAAPVISAVPAPIPEVEQIQAAPTTELVTTIKGDALFAFDRTDIKPEARKQLSEIVGKLKVQQSIEEIVISGHTDADGSETYNQELSKKRAEAVKQFLVDEGVVSKRLVLQALGEALPVASNDTEEGRAKNRRVEISVQTVTTAQ